ncbi:MAG: response regulator [Rhodospirillales bacterium]|nr:response regulator [Rhodospirillales bacterium]MCB9965383.1 response regulator [Rhodospirillales bacterium]MCB9973278.1 response regulator [Rhodospirillales bacterium]MCB9980600.1 response regulator [Rhodospirillales bacterium]
MKYPVNILLVEDNEVDADIACRVFAKSNIENEICSAIDGVEALEILKGSSDKKVSQPCILLIDINLPRMDGLTFLEHVRNDKDLSRNVVFMLTTSSRPQDMDRAYTLNAAGYILKDDILKLGDLMKEYLDISKFPPE